VFYTTVKKSQSIQIVMVVSKILIWQCGVQPAHVWFRPGRCPSLVHVVFSRHNELGNIGNVSKCATPFLAVIKFGARVLAAPVMAAYFTEVTF
jgi:hypothetical protein